MCRCELYSRFHGFFEFEPEIGWFGAAHASSWFGSPNLQCLHKGDLTDNVRQQISAVIDARLQKVVVDVNSRWRKGVILPQHQHELNAVVISGKRVQVSRVGYGEFYQSESVHAFDIYEALQFADLLIYVFDHRQVVVAYGKLGFKRLLQSLHVLI